MGPHPGQSPTRRARPRERCCVDASWPRRLQHTWRVAKRRAQNDAHCDNGSTMQDAPRAAASPVDPHRRLACFLVGSARSYVVLTTMDHDGPIHCSSRPWPSAPFRCLSLLAQLERRYGHDRDSAVRLPLGPSALLYESPSAVMVLDVKRTSAQLDMAVSWSASSNDAREGCVCVVLRFGGWSRSQHKYASMTALSF